MTDPSTEVGTPFATVMLLDGLRVSDLEKRLLQLLNVRHTTNMEMLLVILLR